MRLMQTTHGIVIANKMVSTNQLSRYVIFRIIVSRFLLTNGNILMAAAKNLIVSYLIRF